MTIKVILTDIGADAGPFDLYSNVDGFLSAFATGIDGADLLAGYPIAVPDGTSVVRVKSVDEECNNYSDIGVTTTTTTTTVEFAYFVADYYACVDCGGSPIAVDQIVKAPTTTPVVVSKYYPLLDTPTTVAEITATGSYSALADTLDGSFTYPTCGDVPCPVL